MDYKNTEENLKAISIVKEMVSGHSQLLDMFYSGDSDTLVEAFNNVMSKNIIRNWNVGESDTNNSPKYYELSSEDIEKYKKIYGNDINEECNRLTKLGDDNKIFLDRVLNLLEVFVENVELNRNLNEI